MAWRGIGGAVLVAFALTAGEARAQEACAVPGDVPADVYDQYLDLLGEGFPMDAAPCERLTKTVVSSCHKSVTASTRCWGGLLKSLRKAAKTTCAEQGDEEEACLVGTGNNLAGGEAAVESSSEDGHGLCDAGGEEFLFACLNGLP